MSAVPMSARVRCKNKVCGQKVPLTRDHVRELSGRLRVNLTCQACGERFSTSLLRTPRASVPPAAEPPPVPIPVPVGAKQAPPPFRPLPTTTEPAPITVRPEVTAPGADALPFSPLQTAPADTGKPSGGVGGWWNRQSKRNQYLTLGVGIAVMAGFAFTAQTLTNRPKQQQEQPPEPPPVTAPARAPANRPTAEPTEPTEPLKIDEPSPSDLRIAEPVSPSTRPQRR